MSEKTGQAINSLPNNKILDRFKLKAFADNKMRLKYGNLFGEEQRTLLEKEKMLVTSVFSYSHNVFKRLLIPLKSGDCVVKG